VFAFTDAERAYLAEMRALGRDSRGAEILVGLTAEETEWYMTYSRSLRAEQAPSATQLYLELHDKHEAARLAIILAENERRVEKPRLQ